MASEYELIGTAEDDDGDRIAVGVQGGSVVLIFDAAEVAMADGIGYYFGAAKQEEFAQLYVAACHQAKANKANAEAAAAPQEASPARTG